MMLNSKDKIDLLYKPHIPQYNLPHFLQLFKIQNN